MIQYMYLSKSLSPQDELESTINSILESAIRNNLKHQLSGYIFYLHGHFIRVLEGPINTIDTIYNKILNDQRHQIILEQSCATIKQRSFDKWPMGYDTNLKSIELVEDFCFSYSVHDFGIITQHLARIHSYQLTMSANCPASQHLKILPK